MSSSLSSTGARNVILEKDIIKTVQQRFEKVKKEKFDRIDKWKKSLSKLTKDAQAKVDTHIKEVEKLQKEIGKGKNVKENTKKIKDLQKKINKLKKDKYTSKDLKEAKAKLSQDIMDDMEAHFCPFCGKDFGSADGVKSHLAEKGDGLSDKEAKQMNKVAERSGNYAQKYKKEFGENKFDVDVELDQFDGKMIKVDIGEQIHHLISVEPYSSTLRVSRIGNLIGFNVNDTSNLISSSSIDSKTFIEKHNVPYADLSKKDKYTVSKAVIEKKKAQLHQGGHSFSPAKGIPSYEKKLVQDMSKIEAEVLQMSKDGCVGQSTEGREKVKDLVQKKITKLQDEIKGELTNFEQSKDGKPTVGRYLAQVDYDYHTGKGL